MTDVAPELRYLFFLFAMLGLAAMLASRGVVWVMNRRQRRLQTTAPPCACGHQGDGGNDGPRA